MQKILESIHDRKVAKNSFFYGSEIIGAKRYAYLELEKNATFKKEYDESILKNGNYCQNFYNDLFKWKNIKAIKPIIYDEVNYHNEKLKKHLGRCWYMDMNISIRDANVGRGFTLYEFGNKLLYIMTIRNSRYIYKNNFSNIAYLLDENECNNVLASSDYDPY